MKFKNIYTVAAILGLFILLQSRSGGPATQGNLRVTGAPTEGTCANSTCHTAGSFDPSLSIELLDGANIVTKYDPGKTYTLRITTTAGNGNPARYGFQAVSLNASNAQAGDWGTPPMGMQVKAISSKKYIEHNAPRNTGQVDLPWVAPAAGTGLVTFYSASIASNNNTQTSGDGMANNKLEVEENTTSSITELGKELAKIEVMPNPVADMLNLRITSRLAGSHKIRIFDANGSVVKMEATNLQVGQNTASVPVGELTPGIYLVQLCGDGHMAAVQMLKQ
jgi:Secretion system C-terminal sorting domain/Reeler domain